MYRTSTILDVATTVNDTFVQVDTITNTVTVHRANTVPSKFEDSKAEIIIHKVGPHKVARVLVTTLEGDVMYVSSKVEEAYTDEQREITREEWAEIYAAL